MENSKEWFGISVALSNDGNIMAAGAPLTYNSSDVRVVLHVYIKEMVITQLHQQVGLN